MTIKKLIDEESVLCFWFDNERKIHEAIFPRDAIHSSKTLSQRESLESVIKARQERALVGS